MSSEEEAVYNWMTNQDLYTIKLLISHDVISHEGFARMLKEYFADSFETHGLDFMFEIIDIVIDYADIELINMLLSTLLYWGIHNGNQREKYIRRLIDLGGTMPTDINTLTSLPDGIVDEYVDFENLESKHLLQFICECHTSDRINQKCCDILQCRDTAMPMEYLADRFLELITFGRTTENIFYALKYVHGQPDFEWIIIDTINQTSELTKRSINLFPENYVADEIMSLIILEGCQKSGFAAGIINAIHPDIAKYKDVPLFTYFLQGAPVNQRYTYSYYKNSIQLSPVCRDGDAISAYTNLIQLLSVRITHDKNFFEQKKAYILKHATIVLAALENDVELQLHIAG